jgi:hypothetical protein
MSASTLYSGHDSSAMWSAFGRHFAEMVVAMLVGMAVRAPLVSVGLGAVGWSGLLDSAAIRGALMSAYMIVGMAVWMRYRRHDWRMVGEMAVAMFAPYIALVGPYFARAVSGGVFLVTMHALMLPAMACAMLLRRAAYSESHHRRRA